MNDEFLMDLFCEVSLGNIADTGVCAMHWFSDHTASWASYVEFPENSEYNVDDDYLWDFEISFNDPTGKVLMMSAVDNRYERAVRWIHPDYREQYYSTVKRYGYDIAFMPKSFNVVEVDDLDEMLHQVLTIITVINGPNDPCVLRIKNFLETKTSKVGAKMRDIALQFDPSFKKALEWYASNTAK